MKFNFIIHIVIFGVSTFANCRLPVARTWIRSIFVHSPWTYDVRLSNTVFMLCVTFVIFSLSLSLNPALVSLAWHFVFDNLINRTKWCCFFWSVASTLTKVASLNYPTTSQKRIFSVVVTNNKSSYHLCYFSCFSHFYLAIQQLLTLIVIECFAWLKQAKPKEQSFPLRFHIYSHLV